MSAGGIAPSVDTARDAARITRRARRRRRSRFMTAITATATALALVPLVSIVAYLLARGGRALTPTFFTHAPAAAGQAGGGIANAIAGTLLLAAMASALGVPLGIGAGLYLAERRGTRRAATVRYLADVLAGVPSVVFGIAAWQLLVRPVGHFSALAGGLALGALAIPLVARATEAVLHLTPSSLTDAALALGFPRWRTALTVVLRGALPGVATAALIAVARVAGETAPLLFTAFGNQYWSLRPDQPIAALPLQVFSYAMSPDDGWRRQAYGGAVVLVALVALLTLAGRVARRRA